MAGVWRLAQQEINGQRTDFEPLTLRVLENGNQLSFAFSVASQDVDRMSVSYTLRLDGFDADIKDSNGQKIGIIQMRRGGASGYTFIMKGPNRADSQGTLTVSPDGKTLVSESASTQGGRPVQSEQTFRRD